ncbi:adenosylcobinamide-phosphate synthase CbiB [Candidatus Poriferisocius sp.]|uniref:adenosylcobinamide-phosphate synthase CbiB n=1 Tax=Candidatus Poriferisocius sp. TaxID=3101276 RepID=UPI003B51AAEB
MSRLGGRCLGAAAGLFIDRLVGEPPPDVHPVAGFGQIMERVEHTLWADRRLRGAAYAAVGVAIGAVGGRMMRSTATAVAVATAGRELRRTALSIGEAISDGDLPAARAALPSLVGRDPAELDESGIAAAVIESVAENSVDAVIAPAFWGAVAGAPGAAAYRAINTMDAMVGRRNERYRNFGWAAARLDDAANYIPARIFAALVVVLYQERTRQIVKAVRHDAPSHPSPNAGVAEAAMAAMLGRKLGGPLDYEGVVENRPFLGTGSRPESDDIEAAVRHANRVEIASIGALVLTWLIDWLLDQSED